MPSNWDDQRKVHALESRIAELTAERNTLQTRYEDSQNQLEEARKDTARLNWLNAYRVDEVLRDERDGQWFVGYEWGKDIREAIDIARDAVENPRPAPPSVAECWGIPSTAAGGTSNE